MSTPNTQSKASHTPLSVSQFTEKLPFTPDQFQLDAMDKLASGHSVVVSAPTGSGKTLIAEYAVESALKQGRRIFYTTPLKALSNQKYRDLQAAYGDDTVGLLTGDTNANRDASIVVMTTEIFRNMLYTESELFGATHSSLNDVQFVVLDECHYMNDAQRGTVWEESMIYCPRHLQLIALSATVDNADELSRWIDHIHPSCAIIESDFRPVPLRFYYDDRLKLAPLFEQYAAGSKPESWVVNQSLKPVPLVRRVSGSGKRAKGKQRGGKPKAEREYDPAAMVARLAEKDMLPAIVFTFSRAGCDKALKACFRLTLTTNEERAKIENIIQEVTKDQEYLARHPHLDFLRQGMASHHAGLLPGLKVLVEKLFQEGLIKVVFATETLAAGINMPARTTVITSLSKRTDVGHRNLHASEFMQMAGRAGRRGMDTVGHVVVAGSPYDTPDDAATIATSRAEALNSQFTPTYGMVLNLLQRGTLESAKELIQKSFGQFTWQRRLSPMMDTLAELKNREADYLAKLQDAGLSEEQFTKIAKSRGRLFDAYRDQRTYRNELKKLKQGSSSAKPIVRELKKVQAKIRQLKEILAECPVDVDKFFSRNKKLDEKLSRIRREIRRDERLIRDQEDIYWQQFTHIYNLLKQFKYLNDDDQPTPAGQITSELRTENPLYVTELLLSGVMDDLDPPAMAALACAIVFDSNRDNIVSDWEPSPQASKRLRECRRMFFRISKVQQEGRVDVPVVYNAAIAGLAEAWADGVAWESLLSKTSLAEGDIVRSMRRTADILRQWSRLEFLDPAVADSAYEAWKAISRDPVKEADWTPSTPLNTDSAPEEPATVQADEATSEELEG